VHFNATPVKKTGFNKNLTLVMLSVFVLPGVFLSTPIKTNAQNTQPPISDSTTSYAHSPHKATMYAMVLPGLGQIYNKKYWKVPIVYAGFATLTYFIITNRSEYIKYRDAYDYVTQGDTLFPINNEYVLKYNQSQLQNGRDSYRRNLEFSCILSGLWYIITVLDATVDAHLFDYDISNDLSIRLKPVFNQNRYSGHNVHPALTLTWKF